MILIRRPGGSWRKPETTSYANERELQELVKATSTLLPGAAPSAVVDEFTVPEIGSVDLVAVDADGHLTLVECKLQANPEIRRAVVGQVLAYAGGLWRMPYDAFAAGFAARAGKPLDRAVAQATGSDVDADQLREAVTQRLADGEFRLVIAVDAITAELKRIIEYLNEHTLASVQILALELGYTRDADIELLVPQVYGHESASHKPTSRAWTARTFSEQVQERTTGPARAFVERLLAHGGQRGHHPFYGSGAEPGMSYYYSLEGRPISVWAVYLRRGGPVLSLSFGALSNWSRGRALDFLKELRADSTLNAALAEIDEGTMNRYPSIPIEDVLTNPAAQEAFFVALNRVTRMEPDNRLHSTS